MHARNVDYSVDVLCVVLIGNAIPSWTPCCSVKKDVQTRCDLILEIFQPGIMHEM